MRTNTEVSMYLDFLLKRSYEDEVVEFKEAKNQFDSNKLGKYFSALSNEANLHNKSSAWLIFGVRDSDKALVNTQFRVNPAKLNSLKAEIGNLTTGSISFIQIHEVYKDNKRVLLFEIPAAPKGIPIAWKGHYYGRAGEELGALNPEEYERIRKQTKGKDWSAQIVEKATITDLSPEAIFYAKKSYSRKNLALIAEIKEWSTETFLNKAKITIKDKITNTAILLLGKPESSHFINPASANITWILKDRDNIEKDYEHFSCPLLLNTEKVYKKIRNLKYRYIREDTLFPEEVDQYDPYIIREALNNCIAHQDYQMAGKINVVENEDGKLIFINSGRFIPKSIEEVIISDAPEPIYRNPFLIEAMINLNMIDAIGSGIKKMYLIQKNKFFPLPDYDLDNNKVKVTFWGKVVELSYARKLASVPSLSLLDILDLDKVAKKKAISSSSIKKLKEKKLIEGRKPNFHISASIAETTGEKAEYIKQRGIEDSYCQKIILDYLRKFKEGKRSEFEDILLDKLPDILDTQQKKNKIKNNLQSLRIQNIIYVEGKIWKMSKK